MIWEDIDFDKCEIHFSNNYITTDEFELDENGHIKKEGTTSDYSTLKSSSSCRTIKLDEETMEILKKHKDNQKEFAKKQNVVFSEKDPVFTGRWYKQLGKNTTNDRVKRVMEDLGIKDWKDITSHCLRKTFCCEGLQNDVPLEYMSRLMGHSTTRVTEQYYAEFKQEKVNEYAKQTNRNRVKAIHKIKQDYLVS